jgi:hypothetical protein
MAALRSLVLRRGTAAAWERLGFTATTDGAIAIGGVTVHFSGKATRTRISGWILGGGHSAECLDGVPTAWERTRALDQRECATRHPNGAIAVDSVVVSTKDVTSTVSALEERGGFLLKRRSHEIRPGFDIALFRTNVIVELIGPTLEPDGERIANSARIWGLTVTLPSADFEAIAAELRVRALAGKVRPAVQRGRRIFTCKQSAELGVHLAFMTPHVSDVSGSPRGKL